MPKLTASGSSAAASTAPVPGSSRHVPAGPGDPFVFLRKVLAFLAIGAVLYAALYVWAEFLVYRHATRNRFFAVATLALPRVDTVILGTSHAAVLDYRDMNTRLEALTGQHVLNLALVAAGVRVNRTLLDYYLARRHSVGTVLYFVDSFAFGSRQWNEDRLRDTKLLARAPLSPGLALTLWTHGAGLMTVMQYISGFAKINDADRFAPDLFPDEGERFDRIYRPVGQVEAQRLAYLYRDSSDAAIERYLSELGVLVTHAQANGARVVLAKPPVRTAFYRQLPREERFDASLRSVSARLGVQMLDWSLTDNADEWFMDSDHLNAPGVLRFMEHTLGPALRRAAADAPG